MRKQWIPGHFYLLQRGLGTRLLGALFFTLIYSHVCSGYVFFLSKYVWPPLACCTLRSDGPFCRGCLKDKWLWLNSLLWYIVWLVGQNKRRMDARPCNGVHRSTYMNDSSKMVIPFFHWALQVLLSMKTNLAIWLYGPKNFIYKLDWVQKFVSLYDAKEIKVVE